MVAICRLCASLKKTKTLTFIRDNNHDVCTKLLRCCQLKIDLNNVLPRGVCPECIRNLDASFEFHGRVHESQQSLEKLLNVQKKFKNESEYVSTSEEEKLFEERKSFDLITTATASNLEERTIGKEVPVANSDNNDPLTPEEWSNDDNDGNVSVDDDIDIVTKYDSSKKAICSEKEQVVEIKIKRPSRKTFEEVISGEKVKEAQSGEPTTPGNSNFETALGYVEDQVGEVFDGEFEIIEVIENSQSKEEEGNGVDVIETSRNSPYLGSEYLSGVQEENASSPVFVLDQMTCTWTDYIWKCVHCSEKFCSAHELAKHYKDIEQKESAWVCIDCLKVFQRYYGLINHIRQRHRQQLGLSCDICDKNCKSFAELDSHRRQCTHNDVVFKMLICSSCGKGFNNTNSLQIHSKCHLPDDMRLKFSCNLCEKSFRSSSNLKFHQKMHAGMKDFVCDQCGKKFIQRANLEEHLVTHIEFTPYECDLCNKLFKTSERLSKHKTRHTDDKPFKCNWTGCEKNFRTKDAMNSHTRIHTGEMPFKCEFCQKPFRFRSTLLTHHNIHTGNRPYSCNDCNHQFTNWPNYNKHMKRRHGIDVSSNNPRGKKPSQPRTKINKKNQDLARKTKSMENKVSIDEEVYYHNVEEEREEDEEMKIIELEDLENFDAEYEPKEDII